MSTLAITGATGFVGGHLLDRAAAKGHLLRALARRPQQPRDNVEWLSGALDDAASLAALVDGADAVIHVAGLVTAPDRAGFEIVNIGGVERLVAVAEKAEARRFILVSSLAAREPGLSDYGWSKRCGEGAVERSNLDWTIIRPPAVYGPGDREMLDLFRMARRGFVLLPPPGRFSIIHAADLADLLLACLDEPETVGKVYEPDDGTQKGWSHQDFARALGRAQDRSVRAISTPSALMRLGVRGDRLMRGSKARLTADRARYFAHPDWVARDEFQPPRTLWSSQIPTETGLRETAEWYRRKGWLGRT